MRNNNGDNNKIGKGKKEGGRSFPISLGGRGAKICAVSQNRRRRRSRERRKKRKSKKISATPGVSFSTTRFWTASEQRSLIEKQEICSRVRGLTPHLQPCAFIPTLTKSHWYLVFFSPDFPHVSSLCFLFFLINKSDPCGGFCQAAFLKTGGEC